MFTQDNTQGYGDDQLKALNSELSRRLTDAGVEPGSDEAVDMEKAFSNEVARR